MILLAVVPLIQVDVLYAGICYDLSALSGREGLCLHSYQFEEVQHALRKKKAEAALVELCLCSICFHNRKGDSFLRIYPRG